MVNSFKSRATSIRFWGIGITWWRCLGGESLQGLEGPKKANKSETLSGTSNEELSAARIISDTEEPEGKGKRTGSGSQRGLPSPPSCMN